MKKQYLFGVLAVSAAFASCNNEIETVTENMKPEAEMEKVVGATLVSKGMSIDVNGMESRRTGEGWEETDLLGMGWYNVNPTSISQEQTKADWEATMSNSLWSEHRIFANHKFINFATESNVYQGAHFVYYPYQRETKIQQKVVKANALDFAVSSAEGMDDALYDMYNRAFYLSAQDFVAGNDVNENGELEKAFRLSPMVNGITIKAVPTLEETATSIKGLKIASVDIYSSQAPFAETFAIKPNLIPAVVRNPETNEIDGAKTDEALDAYIKGAEKTYVQHAVRNVAADYDLSAQRNINVFTFPTNKEFKDYANNGNKYTEMITVNVVSEHGLTGSFSIGSSSVHTAKNKAAIQTLNGYLGTGKAASLQNVVRLSDGTWTTIALTTELDESNLTMNYNINNIDQWNDAVALASEIGKDATFTLVGDVDFTGTTVNFPSCKLTVVGDKALVLKGVEMEWPADANVDLTAANITVEEGTTLAINGVEEMRNTLAANVTNKGTIALNEYAKISKKDNAQIENVNGRIEVKYGSYVYADGGIVAFEVETETPAYQINNLITDDSTDADDGQALVNTLVVNEGQVLDLCASNEAETTYDPYAGIVTTVPAATLDNLSNINIEMNGGTLKSAIGLGKSVKNIKVLEGQNNAIWNTNVNGALFVESGVATVDAEAVNGVKTSVKIGSINVTSKLVANVTIYTKDIANPKGATTVVTDSYVIWYTGEYTQGGSATGKILKSGTGASIGSTTYATLQEAFNNVTDGESIKLEAGVYDQEIVLSDAKEITLESASGNPEDVVFTGRLYKKNLAAGSKVTVKNVTITAASAISTPSDSENYAQNTAIYAHYDNADYLIEGCIVSLPDNCKLFKSWHKASGTVTIKDCIFTNCTTSPIQISGNSVNIIKNNTFSGSAEAAVTVSCEGGQLTFENNIVGLTYGILLHKNWSTANWKIVTDGTSNAYMSGVNWASITATNKSSWIEVAP